MKVKIFKPAKTATQSGLRNIKLWLMKITPEKDSRYINPLMGWTSSDDTKTQLQFTFQTKEEAVEYAVKQGFEYVVIEPKTSIIKKKSYASNFI